MMRVIECCDKYGMAMVFTGIRSVPSLSYTKRHTGSDEQWLKLQGQSGDIAKNAGYRFVPEGGKD